MTVVPQRKGWLPLAVQGKLQGAKQWEAFLRKRKPSTQRQREPPPCNRQGLGALGAVWQLGKDEIKEVRILCKGVVHDHQKSLGWTFKGQHRCGKIFMGAGLSSHWRVLQCYPFHLFKQIILISLVLSFNVDFLSCLGSFVSTSTEYNLSKGTVHTTNKSIKYSMGSFLLGEWHAKFCL